MKKEERQRNERLYELKKKSPGVAAGLSVLLVGSGHMYIGKVAVGFVLMFITLMLWFVLMGWIMWIIVPIFAYKETKAYNEQLMLELGL